MSISAAQVKELRERTGAGMMECKRALEATSGDMEAAIEKMRKEGQAKADKKAGRVAAEGAIFVATTEDGSEAVLLEVNSETDFVAKDDNFVSFGGAAVNSLLASDISEQADLENLQIDGASLDEARRSLIAQIGENISVRRFARVATEGGRLGVYQHGSRIAVIVDVNGGDENLAKDLAMHVAASSPQFVSAGDVDPQVLDKEREILTAQAKESGKPDDIVAKMVDGRIGKYVSEITLLGQPFVKDPDTSVEKLLKSKNATVNSFVRFEVGEGIERAEEDFAAEVKAQAEASRN